MNRSANRFFKGFLTSLLIFFSLFSSTFALPTLQQPIKRVNKTIAILNTEKKPINEIAAGSQNRELPETPFEDTKKEENETDDDDNKDESYNHAHSIHSILIKIIEGDQFIRNQDKVNRSSRVPIYILFHSWKSFLI